MDVYDKQYILAYFAGHVHSLCHWWYMDRQISCSKQMFTGTIILKHDLLQKKETFLFSLMGVEHVYM